MIAVPLCTRPSTCRNQRPQLGTSPGLPPPGRSEVTGWRRPSEVSCGLYPCSRTSPVGSGGQISPRGGRKDLAEGRAEQRHRGAEGRTRRFEQRAALAHIAHDIVDISLRDDAALAV